LLPVCLLIERAVLVVSAVLSHMHEDHFDRLVEEKLDRSIPIISDQYAVSRLMRKGFHAAFALDNWQSAVITKGPTALVVTSLPGQHAPSSLMQAMHLLPPVMGSLLEFTRNHHGFQQQTTLPLGRSQLDSMVRLYISGDTLLHDALKVCAAWPGRPTETRVHTAISLKPLLYCVACWRWHTCRTYRVSSQISTSPCFI